MPDVLQNISTTLSTTLTPTLYTTLLTLSILYILTLSPHPSSPSFNLDYIFHLLSFLFPPLSYIYSLALSYTLCLLTLSKPLSLTPPILCVWITFLYTLTALNTHFGHGAPRRVVWREQIAVVTGGAGGLGWLIAKILELKGAEVVIWDIQAPNEWTEEEGGVKWYKVDVGDADAVETAYQRVVKEVCRPVIPFQFHYLFNPVPISRTLGEKREDACMKNYSNSTTQVGTPTILINNAGIVNGKPLLSLSASQISRCFHINTLSHFHTCRSFIPAMLSSPTGGTIVTVSSVLGHLGASHLTDYTATKAALLAFHTSLRSEIAQYTSDPAYPGAQHTKMILVKPGQLSTAMFSTLQSPSDFFGPVVQARDLAREIVEAIEQGRNGVVCMPVYTWLIEWLGVLPVSLQRAARWMSGVDGAMQTFGSKRE
jgi:NAD(P)-dependent dehydrogenase (short-subunit alcohol dehydrogenase family)